jgi:hypothetical protein
MAMVNAARISVVAILALLGTWTVSPGAARANPAVTEYQVKAVFLLNFARFVTWPESAFATPGAPLTVCVLGQDPFGSVLDEVLANERIGDRPLAARRLASDGGTDGCQLLFVGAGDVRRHGTLLQALTAQPVLTVGDEEAFAREGGMVGLHLEDGTVRITVNPDAVRDAGLTMSSQLLRMARIVGAAS